jgi:MtN3 and saliva related transmembrane protein
MTSSFVETIGFIAALLTTAAFVPQTLHSLRTRNLEGVSLSMYVIFTAGVALWFTYGLLIESWPVIAANAVTLVLAGMILILKIRHR